MHNKQWVDTILFLNLTLTIPNLPIPFICSNKTTSIYNYEHHISYNIIHGTFSITFDYSDGEKLYWSTNNGKQVKSGEVNTIFELYTLLKEFNESK